MGNLIDEMENCKMPVAISRIKASASAISEFTNRDAASEETIEATTFDLTGAAVASGADESAKQAN
jgi:hypothetical protein